jgi:starvation-inducible DNA-binding protein
VVDLSLEGRQLHWTVVGPLFRPLHLQIDELVEAWRELADTDAERLSRSAFPPMVRVRPSQGTPLRPVARGELDDHVVVRDLTSHLAEVAERARERVDRLGELDAATQDVQIEVVRALEKQLSMIRVQFPDVHKC